MPYYPTNGYYGLPSWNPQGSSNPGYY
jgi:hypothetical protein